MTKAEFLPPANDPSASASQLFDAVADWLGDFCCEHGFADKNGRTKFARAMNLLSGHAPKTKAESKFLDAMVLELEYRFPGDRYPAAAVRRAGRPEG